MTVPGDHAILFVHAHPDDESIGTGATMAAYAARGVAVCLVTCTLGEEGEIALTDLAGLAAGQADQLGGYRLTELGQACAALGVTDHRMLGGAGRYRDSGMAGLPSNEHPRAFCRAELDTAATELLAVIDDVRPSVVVTYDPQGFYGHPDHVMAHRVTHRACERAAAAGIGPRKIYWTALPQPVVAAGLAAFARTTGNPFADARSPDDLPFAAPAEQVTTRIDAAAFAAAKTRAMLAHATQLPATSWLFMVASNFGAEPLGVEFFRLAFGDRGRGSGRFGWESDLLAGLR